MSDAIFRELGLPRPDHRLNWQRSTPAADLAVMKTLIEEILVSERPVATVVFGDVTTTVAGAMASARAGIPIAHVEAGVHTERSDNPEEINRRATEALAHTLFAHTEEAYRTLLRSDFPADRVFLTGDIVRDCLRLIVERHRIEAASGDYVVATVHRAENTDDPIRLAAICDALMTTRKDVRLPLHPRTRAALERFGLLQGLEACPDVTLLPPLSYVDIIRLVAGAERVVSDSGGLRREAYILGKPVVSLIDMVWVPAMVQCGWEMLADADTNRIGYGLDHFTPPAERPDIFGDGHAADRMVSILLDRYGSGAARLIGGEGTADRLKLSA